MSGAYAGRTRATTQCVAPSFETESAQQTFEEILHKIDCNEFAAFGGTNPKRINKTLCFDAVLPRSSLLTHAQVFLRRAKGNSNLILLDLHGIQIKVVLEPLCELLEEENSVLVLNLGEMEPPSNEELSRRFLRALYRSVVSFGFMSPSLDTHLSNVAQNMGDELKGICLEDEDSVARAILRRNRNQKPRAQQLIRHNLFWIAEEGQCWISPRALINRVLDETKDFPRLQEVFGPQHTDWMFRDKALGIRE